MISEGQRQRRLSSHRSVSELHLPGEARVDAMMYTYNLEATQKVGLTVYFVTGHERRGASNWAAGPTGPKYHFVGLSSYGIDETWRDLTGSVHQMESVWSSISTWPSPTRL